MTMYETRGSAEAASAQLNEPVPLHRDNVFQSGDDGDAAPAEQI